MKLKRFSLICGVAILILTIGLLGVAYAKSLYLASEHHQKLFDAWNINPDGTITKQATYGLQYATDPAGIAIHNYSKIIFITSEMSGGGNRRPGDANLSGGFKRSNQSRRN